MAKHNEAKPGNTSENAEVPNFKTDRLVEGARDFLLRSVRENGMKKAWHKMTEGEQTLEIERATDEAQTLVDTLVDMVVTHGKFTTVRATIDSFNTKGDVLKIVTKAITEDTALLALHRAGSHPIQLVFSDPNQFDKSRSNLKADPDQPNLPGVEDDEGFEDEDYGDDGDGVEFNEADEPAPFDNEAEQAEGEAALELKPETAEEPREGGDAEQEEHKPTDTEQAGWDAYESGLDEAANPHKRNPKKTEWLNGWNNALAAHTGSDPASETDEAEVVENELPTISDQTGGQDADAEEPTPEQAHKEGHDARKDGKPPKANPYVPGELFDAWQSGYIEARSKERAEETGGFDD
jgi:ribosome modulation factor